MRDIVLSIIWDIVLSYRIIKDGIDKLVFFGKSISNSSWEQSNALAKCSIKFSFKFQKSSFQSNFKSNFQSNFKSQIFGQVFRR